METKYFAMAALLFGLAACSNDEPTTEALDDGKPVIAHFIGCIDKVQSRADGVIWDAGDAIGISGGEYTNIKYLADTKGSDRHFTAENEDDEIYFKEKGTINFIAYHPYTGTNGTPGGMIHKTITAADQEGPARQQIDFMFGSGSGNKSAASVELNIQHKMSQITLNFKSGGDDMGKLTQYTLKGVSLTGQFDTGTGAVQATGNATDLEMNPTGITGNLYSKSLIIYPQAFSAPIPIEVIWDGQMIAGQLKIEDNILMANSNYICDITVSKEGLEVNTIKGGWNDEVESGDAEEVSYFYASLPAIPSSIEGISELKVTVDGNQPEIENDKYVLRAGQKLEISFKLNSGKVVKSFEGWVEQGVCSRMCSYNETTGVSTCTYFDIISDLTIGDLNLTTGNSEIVGLAPQIGDYYYSDGTWSNELDGGKTCIGIVFKAGAGNKESGFMGLNKINGYAIALSNTVNDLKAFASNSDLPELEVGYEVYTGYSTTHRIAKRADFAEEAYWACYSALNYSPAAPERSSGWYLPSLAEFIDLCPNMVEEGNREGKIEINIGKAGGTKLRVNHGTYWSASKLEKNHVRPAAYDFGWKDYRFPYTLRIHTESYSDVSYVRPVLAF